MDLVVPIAANVVLGVLLFALFSRPLRASAMRLTGPDEALAIFRLQFPDATGTATVAADQLGSLIALHGDPRVGLIQRHGQRWTTRVLAPPDLLSVAESGTDALNLSLADFGWPQASVRISDPQVRAAWLSRLTSLAALGSQSSPSESPHA